MADLVAFLASDRSSFISGGLFDVDDMAVVTVFRLYQQQVEEAESRGEDTGIGRYRRQLEAANRDQGIVFCGEPFGIFRHDAGLMLVGVSVRARSWMGVSTQTGLARGRARPQNTA